MMAPAGHVTVVVVKAVVPELHTVETSCPADADTDGVAAVPPLLLLDALVDGETAAPLCDALTEREREGLPDRDGLTEALTILHCT